MSARVDSHVACRVALNLPPAGWWLTAAAIDTEQRHMKSSVPTRGTMPIGTDGWCFDGLVELAGKVS